MSFELIINHFHYYNASKIITMSTRVIDSALWQNSQNFYITELNKKIFFLVTLLSSEALYNDWQHHATAKHQCAACCYKFCFPDEWWWHQHIMTLCIKMLPNVPQLFGTQNTGLIVLNVYWNLEKGGKKAGAFITYIIYIISQCRHCFGYKMSLKSKTVDTKNSRK